MADINLLPQQEKAAENTEFWKKKLTFISIGSLVFAGIFTLGTLVMFTASAASRNKLIDEIETNSSAINNYKTSEELIVVIKNKVSTAGKIISARPNYKNFFESVSSLVPSNVYFTDMRFSQERVVFSGKARTSADMAGLVGAMVSSDGANLLSGVTVESLSSDETGAYVFVVSAKYLGD